MNTKLQAKQVLKYGLNFRKEQAVGSVLLCRSFMQNVKRSNARFLNSVVYIALCRSANNVNKKCNACIDHRNPRECSSYNSGSTLSYRTDNYKSNNNNE